MPDAEPIARGTSSAGASAAAGRWPHVVILDPYNSGLALARRMVRLGARVTLIVDPDYTFVTRSRGVESFITPFGASGEAWLELLRELAAGSRELAVLPATDRSSELLVHAAGRLPRNARAFEHSASAHLALMDKEQADAIARRAGVPVPWTARVNSREELAAVADDAPWPCVVKPILSHEWRARFGETRVFLTDGAEQAAALLERPLKARVGMLLSQYIPGGDEDVEEAIVVRLADGSYPVSFGCRKLRQYPRGFGITSVGESSPLPGTMTLARRILDHAGFVGVAGVEVKRHAQTGQRWLIEVNVRVPGQWCLGDACGVRASPRLIDALMGAELGPQPPLRAGVRMVLPDIDALAVLPELRAAPAWRRPALALGLVRAYSGAREFGLLDPRDPGPGLALAGAIARMRMSRLRALLRRPSGTKADGAPRSGG
jgi:D-aspartate ligase